MVFCGRPRGEGLSVYPAARGCHNRYSVGTPLSLVYVIDFDGKPSCRFHTMANYGSFVCCNSYAIVQIRKRVQVNYPLFLVCKPRYARLTLKLTS